MGVLFFLFLLDGKMGVLFFSLTRAIVVVSQLAVYPKVIASDFNNHLLNPVH